jgi:uncharacterized protein YecE (DUF72 family)
MPESASPWVTGPIVYVRLHGFDTPYGGHYSAATLERWAIWLGRVRDDGRDVYLYFNTDREAHGQEPRMLGTSQQRGQSETGQHSHGSQQPRQPGQGSQARQDRVTTS